MRMRLKGTGGLGKVRCVRILLLDLLVLIVIPSVFDTQCLRASPVWLL